MAYRTDPLPEDLGPGGALVSIPNLARSHTRLLWAVARADWYLDRPFWPQSGQEILWGPRVGNHSGPWCPVPRRRAWVGWRQWSERSGCRAGVWPRGGTDGRGTLGSGGLGGGAGGCGGVCRLRSRARVKPSGAPSGWGQWGNHSLSRERRPHSYGPFSHMIYCCGRLTRGADHGYRQTDRQTPTPLSTQSTQAAGPRCPRAVHERPLLSPGHQGPLTGDGHTGATARPLGARGTGCMWPPGSGGQVPFRATPACREQRGCRRFVVLPTCAQMATGTSRTGLQNQPCLLRMGLGSQGDTI